MGIGTKRRLSLGLGLLTALAVGRDAEAMPTIDPLDIQGMELANGSMMDRPPVMAWGRSGVVRHPVLDQMRNEVGHVWANWDLARGHFGGLITTGIPYPGTVSNPARAEDVTLAWLERYIAVLAPGSSIDDFEVVSNDYSSGIRTVGLLQYADGLPVRGGQMSVRFKADRLVYVASQALPGVDVVPHTGPMVDVTVAHANAKKWVEGDYPGASITTTGGLGSPFILPIWTGTSWSYHEVVQVTADATTPLGRWAVYLDVATGAPVAREQQLHSVGTVLFNVPERHPGSTRSDEAAPQLNVSEFGANSTTDDAGEVALNNSPTTLNTTVTGPRVNIMNEAGPDAQGSFPITDGGSLVWNDSGNEFVDAQLSAFVHTSQVKEYVRGIDPGFGWLDSQMDVFVNIGGSCNAASNGANELYFLQADGSCQNTARLADVVHHEIGHSVHGQSIIPGVGEFEGALSEGISDYLASTMVNDSGMGRGFTYSDDPLRELNPDGFEWTWPQDKGEVHVEGQIIGGTLWDLRTALVGTLGAQAGVEHTDLIYFEGSRRAVDIPSMYPEALVVDDDDGDLSNGTPNICEINEAFEDHGLFSPSESAEFEVTFSQQFNGGEVMVMSMLPMVAGCATELGDATLRWRVRGDGGPGDELSMDLEDGVFTALIPTQETGVVVEYQVVLTYSDGDQQLFPRNAADLWYQAFFGAADPIYCFDGDADPAEWTFSGPGGNWSFGPLMESGVDPAQPYDEDGALLSQDGDYSANSNSFATSPIIDLTGYQDVRLHYRRWLTVEDGFYDEATIYANGQVEWSNLASNQQQGANVHHIDQEWRFQDVPLNDHLEAGQVTLSFGLQSDQGLHLGGWTVDALCVVEVLESVCGDGEVSGGEQCDDGNNEDGDGCDAECVFEDVDPPDPTGGESDTDGGSGGGSGADDDTGGNMTNGPSDGSGDSTGDDAGQDGGVVDEGCGCVTGSSDSPLRGGAWLLLLVAGGAVRRRRVH